MLVQVTREHIRLGVPRDGNECAIAVCLRQMGYDDVCVGPGWVAITKAQSKVYYGLPKVLAQWMSAFDRKQYVEPITFIMEPE